MWALTLWLPCDLIHMGDFLVIFIEFSTTCDPRRLPHLNISWKVRFLSCCAFLWEWIFTHSQTIYHTITSGKKLILTLKKWKQKDCVYFPLLKDFLPRIFIFYWFSLKIQQYHKEFNNFKLNSSWTDHLKQWFQCFW